MLPSASPTNSLRVSGTYSSPGGGDSSQSLSASAVTPVFYHFILPIEWSYRGLLRMRTSFLRQMTMVFGYAHNFILPGYKYAMEKKWETVYNLLSSGSYPSDFDKSQRQNLRRYASNFQIKG
ncbi:hypothetical protein AMEX_G25399 [Astyanax mexicanus]|uniref:Uncharacterized protein n=1 Tax=Astyanax mexicanus TaxID=7994 RepID=A0A8T2KT13_ASTMX|nr:hypothetical protein AMEX_G25399 [Astyanax mexicanus]